MGNLPGHLLEGSALAHCSPHQPPLSGPGQGLVALGMCWPGGLCPKGVARGLQRGQADSTLSHKVPTPGTSRRFPGSWFCRDPHSPVGAGDRVPPCLEGWASFGAPQALGAEAPTDPTVLRGAQGSPSEPRQGAGCRSRAQRRAGAERWQQLGRFLDINRHSQESGEEGAGAVPNKAGRAAGVQPSRTGCVERAAGCQGSPGDVPGFGSPAVWGSQGSRTPGPSVPGCGAPVAPGGWTRGPARTARGGDKGSGDRVRSGRRPARPGQGRAAEGRDCGMRRAALP